MKEFDLKYKEIDLVVKGYYTEGEPQTYDYPGSPADFSVCEVTLQGVDISVLMSDLDLETIEEQILDKYY